MTKAMEPAEAVLVGTSSSPNSKTYAERSKLTAVPISTLWHHEHGRLSRKDAAAKRQYLTPSEEKTVVDYIQGAAEGDHPVLVKSVGQLAWTIARRRSSTFEILADDDSIRPPGKNWVQKFYKRHNLKTRTLKPLDWARHDIYDKVAHWFTLMDRVLHDSAVLPENVYNMDETGNLLSNLTSRKYVLHAADRRKYRGATIKRQLVTTIECISAAGEYLSPLVIWPAATQRSDWTTHSTPGWHYACSPKGYSNTTIILDWYRQVFDPETKQRANGRPRVMINDGFGPHECLEVQQFCRDNNIILCQLPSHTSHKLQPCDVSLFGPLKTAYRDLVEDMCSKGVKNIGKQHFTLLYDQARCAALTPANIESAWAKVGLFKWDPDRVLRDIQKPPDPMSRNSRMVDAAHYDEPLRTPVTAEQFASLRKKIEQNMPTLDGHNQQCLQKMVHAAEKFVSARDLLHQECSDKFKQTIESDARASMRSIVVGKGKIMSFEDIEEARAKREKKEIAQARRRGRKGKTSTSGPAPGRGKQTRAEELEEADCEIDALVKVC